MFYIYNVRTDDILSKLCDYYFNHDVDLEETQKALVSFGLSHGFSGNIVQTYITYFLMMDENAFSLSRERKAKSPDDSVRSIALKDIASIRELFFADYEFPPEFETFNNESVGSHFNDRSIWMIHRLTMELANADSADEFLNELEHAYSQYGVGNLGLHKAFRVDENASPVPIRRISTVVLDDLVGLERQKEELVLNTRSFVSGLPANNCLLYGDAGTGKSTSIKAIANEFYADGLRIIEVYKHQLGHINEVISKIKDRNYKFILYMDDLSFEDFETEYKYLKAVIEGGLEKRPDNVLIYATSNRRHLVRESFKDRNDDIHSADTMQEKLSLFGRFGVTIYYGAPNKQEYQEILKVLRQRYKLDITEEELIEQGNTWEIRHGGRSGRSATQFIEYLVGKNSN